MIGIDTDCIIDFLKSKKEAIEIVRKYRNELVTTDVNVFEVFIGIYIKHLRRENEEEIAEQFFQNLEVLSFKKGCGKLSALILTRLISMGKTIEQNDAYIASIMASCGGKKIITRNRKHFSMIKGVEVISY